MRISRLMMPAVTLAGALALAGCGGGSDTPAGQMPPGGEGCDAPKIKDGDDCLTPAEYRAKIAKEVEEENKRTEEAKQKVADASALYARLVTATADAADADGILDGDQSGEHFAEVVPIGTKAEHKGIHALRNEGQTWLYAIDDSQSDEQIGNGVGNEVTSGTNAGYYPIDVGDASSVHTVKAAAFTQRVGLEHKTGASFSGEYMGVPGTFKCTGPDGCTSSPASGENRFTLSTDDDGKWHFKPNDRMARLQGASVAEWGWWLATKGTGDDAEAGAGDINLHGSVTNLTASVAHPPAGEATYSGKALGQYAVVDGADSESGAFEATASLTAKFSGARGITTKLSGRVHDFDVNSGWEVTLKENGGNNATGVFDGKTVWKTGGEDGLGEGDWRATTYGGSATAEPTHVVGGFTAVDVGASMVGAFGGEPPKQE